jgi:hypothetical protein
VTVYGPDIEAALSRYSNELDDLSTTERQPVVDLNAINYLTEFREEWQNASDTATEHQLSTAANTNDLAYLQTRERGQYVSGYEAQVGTGVRIPQLPTGDSEMRWGYYTVDTNNDPVDGFYFGADDNGIFVAFARGGVVNKVYQENWNQDTLDGTGMEQDNPSEGELSIADGHIFQIEFTYYGYGPVKFSILMDDVEGSDRETSRLIEVHKTTFTGQTSIEQTNLPLRQDIQSGGTSNDALDLYVGGRQFSLLGTYTTNNRQNSHYRDTLTGVDDTQWYPAVSVKVKDGTDIGTKDFLHVVAEVFGLNVSNDSVPKRWQIRRGTTLDTATWQDPESVEGNTDETALKVDVSATSIGDGSGNATGYYMDGGTLPSGGNQRRDVTAASATGKITTGDIVTLAFRAQDGEGTGAVNAIDFKWEERW